MPRKPWTDSDDNDFWDWMKYIDQISLYFPYIILAILGFFVAFTFGA